MGLVAVTVSSLERAFPAPTPRVGQGPERSPQSILAKVLARSWPPILGVALALLDATASAHAATWTLERVLETVRRSDPGVRAARAEGKAGRAEAAASFASFLPRVSLEAGLTRSDDPALIFSQKLWQGRLTAQDFDPSTLNQPPAATGLHWGVTVEQPIWNGGELLGPSLAARRARAAAATEAARLGDRLFETVQAYVSALRARGAVTAESLATAAAAEHRRAAVERFRFGQASEYDTLRTVARWAEARSAWLDRRRELSTALERLSQLTGARIEADELAIPAEDEHPAFPSRGEAPRLDAARANAARLALEARRDGWALLPSLNARFTAFGYRDQDQEAFERRWMAAGLLEFPLWDGLERIGRWRAARARAEGAEEETEVLTRAVALETADARAQRSLSAERRDAAGIGRRASEEALRLAAERYRAGLMGLSDLLAADADASRARLREIEAQADAVLADYRLLHALGGLR